MRRYALRVGLACFVVLLVLMIAYTAVARQKAAVLKSDLADARQYLKGTVIVVDPGHGGDDPGAVVGETLEKHIVLEIARVLQQVLTEQGARVVLTRETDTSLGGPMREELGKRVALVEQNHADLFVSIHANKDTCYCWGAQTFYQKNGMPAGQELAVAIQSQLRRLTPTTRGPLPANYFVLRNSPAPAAMVEVGFLTNAKEQRMLQEPEYHRTLAQAITLGMADFLRLQVPEAHAGGSLGR
ncbi:MAG: N-acetylmuramoyl-L-alanine amidase [Mycobacterium leprae]